MASKENNKTGCLVVAVVLALLAGGGFLLGKHYEALQRQIRREFEALPKFDDREAATHAAAELGTSYPVPPPTASVEKIKSAIEVGAKRAAEEKYPSAKLAKAISRIAAKYKTAKPGDQVSVFLMTTGRNVTGRFNGSFSDYRGRWVRIDLNQYRLLDIVEDQRYIFDAALASRLASFEISKTKNEFHKKKLEYFKTRQSALEKELYKQAGYANVSGKWRPIGKVVADKVNEARDKYRRRIERKKEEILAGNKFLGVFQMTPPEQNTDK